VIMTLNHWPGPVPRFTSQPLGLVSAAEGFVFVSGLTAGLVYSRMAANQGAPQVRSRAHSRSAEIYRMHVLFLALIFAMGLIARTFQALPASWSEMIPFLNHSPLQGFIFAAFLVFQPKYFNILPLYMLLVMLIPPVLDAFYRKKFVQVFSLSLCFWGLAQLGLTEYLYRYLNQILGFQAGLFFDPFAWQILFVAGLWLGHQRHLGIRWLNRNRFLLAVCLLSALVMIWYRYQIKNEIYPIVSLLGVDMSNWTSRSRLGPLRLFNFLILLQIFSCLISRFPRIFTWRWSIFLGRYSLMVFSYHVILIYLAYAFNEISIREISPYTRYMISILGAISLFIPALLAQRFDRGQLGKS